MKMLHEGKTKDVLERDDGLLLLKFKDTVTGADGEIDPGANEVMGEVTNKGKASFLTSVYFLRKLEEEGIPTHFVEADSDEHAMTVRAAETFGDGLEFICRKYACGSFLRRYGRYAPEMAELPYLVEITLKDDERGDPLINDDTLLALNILGEEELRRTKELTVGITKIVGAALAQYGLRLVDIKYEFGKVDGEIVLIDEISGDGMRALDGAGNGLDQVQLCETLCGRF